LEITEDLNRVDGHTAVLPVKAFIRALQWWC